MHLSIVSPWALRTSRLNVADQIGLPADEVHIWWAGLRVESSALCACWDLLSQEETKLASSLSFCKGSAGIYRDAGATTTNPGALCKSIRH